MFFLDTALVPWIPMRLVDHITQTYGYYYRTEPDSLTEAMNEWRNGLITNWEYLMILNGLAGRSYNDLMQYPVMPFVLADYTSKILDLTDPTSFRDLSKPMAVQNKNREQHYMNTYNVSYECSFGSIYILM